MAWKAMIMKMRKGQRKGEYIVETDKQKEYNVYFRGRVPKVLPVQVQIEAKTSQGGRRYLVASVVEDGNPSQENQQQKQIQKQGKQEPVHVVKFDLSSFLQDNQALILIATKDLTKMTAVDDDPQWMVYHFYKMMSSFHGKDSVEKAMMEVLGIGEEGDNNEAA